MLLRSKSKIINPLNFLISDFTYELLIKQRDWYINEQEIKADLSKKEEGKKEQRNIFGIEGSFRAIRID